MRSKEERRALEQKHKQKTKKLIKNVWKRPELAEDERFVGIETGVHSDRCSCSMCQTSRRNAWLKSNRLPVSERKELLDVEEQMDEEIDNK